MLHGKNEAKNLNKLRKKHFLEILLGSSLPSIKIKKEILKKINIIDLIILSKLEKSKSEIRRLIKGNAIKIK